MEMETICRLKLPIIVIIINNNGIYSGISKQTWESLSIEKSGRIPKLPSTSLLPDANYELISTAFGGLGYFVTTPGDLRDKVSEALNQRKPAIINCIIETTGVRKSQEHSWLTKKVASKL